MKKSILILAGFGVALTGGPVLAEPSFSVTGMLRQEMAYSTGDPNQHTNWGNIYNGVQSDNYCSNLAGAPLAAGVFVPTDFSCSKVTRSADFAEDPDWKQFATRVEIDVQARFTENLSGYLKLRGYREEQQEDFLKDLDAFGDNGINKAAVPPGGFGLTRRNTPLDDGRGSAFETNDDDYMLDLPALYLDYNKGPLWLRVGNQQIAWGEALFFRVFDSVQGLDLRRHSVFGVAAEEYSDSRIPSLAIRGSYRFDNDWELEAYAQQFRPTILPRPGTPYSLVAQAFTVYEQPGFEKDEDDIDVGFRYSGSSGNFDLSFMAIARTTPDGTYRWTNNNLGNNFGVPEAAGASVSASEDGLAFAPDPTGTASADEWFWGASYLRFDPVGALNASVSDAPFLEAATYAGAFNVGTSEALARAELDLFFTTDVDYAVDANGADIVSAATTLTGFGPLRGYLARDYDEEVILGASMKYVFMGEPDSFTDQLILGVETTYAQDRQFTSPSLSQAKIVEDEFTSVVSLEKYHKFSAAFPATYIVGQWMHKSESDMFGRHLSGNGSSFAGGTPTGDDQFNAIALAVQQPFPNLIYRADLSILYDLEGGVFVQPGVKWRPRDNFQLDVYANIMDSDGGNDDIMGTLETQDEIFARLSFYF